MVARLLQEDRQAFLDPARIPAYIFRKERKRPTPKPEGYSLF